MIKHDPNQQAIELPTLETIHKDTFPVVPIINDSKIIISDNMCEKHGVPHLPDKSVALTFTSPPYWNYIDYKGGQGVGNKESTYSDYLNSLEELFSCVYDKTIPGGRFVVNASNMKSRRAIEGESFVYPLVSDIIQMSTLIGFTFFDEVIWDKRMGTTGALGGKPLFGSYPYPPTPKMLTAIFENVLIFTKDGSRKVDKSVKEESKLTKQQWNEWTRGIWSIKTDANTGHPATFPIELAERVIQLYSFVGDTVIDPFVGTGTTVFAAINHNRNAIGWEISPEYSQEIISRKYKLLEVR